MDTSMERLQVLQILVDELMKDAPAETIVVDCMKAAGLKDSKDPIDRINQVLKALHFEIPSREINE